VVVALLSERYLRSTYGRLEWQAALRADPTGSGNKLVTVRLEDCELTGLLATITYVDLVGVTDPGRARKLLLDRLRESAVGRAKPARRPAFPHQPAGTLDGFLPDDVTARRPRSRRAPINPPAFPPASRVLTGGRNALTVLHVPGPRFGRGLAEPGTPAAPGELQEHVISGLTLLLNDGVPRPDLIMVTGNLTASGGARQFEEALSFLTGLRVLVGLEPHRLVVVPGPHDVTAAASRAYFATCEADDIEPQPPYWPKWRHYARLFDELYQGLDEPIFDSEQPWTMFTVPELRLAIAGFNSTIAHSHREADQYGLVSEAQATSFAQWLHAYRQDDWLRIGVMAHAPGATDTHAAYAAPDALRDGTTFNRLVAPTLNLLVCDVPESRATTDAVTLTVAAAPNQSAQLLHLTTHGLTRWTVGRDDRYDDGVRSEHQWDRSAATFGMPPQLDSQPPSEAEPLDDADTSRLDVRAKAADATDALLERVAEVCEARHDRAVVRRRGGDLPHLFVTYRDENVIRQERVGGHVGTPSAEAIDRFVRQVYAADPDIPSTLVYDGEQRIPRGLHQATARRGVSVVSLTEFQGLLDLRDYVAAQSSRLQHDRRYAPDLYVRQRFRHLVGADRSIHEDAVDELIDIVAQPEGRFVLVLGDFGRGKTFALREVARRLPTVRRDLIPILIELRTLEKAHTVDSLVAAHLANHGEDRIDLKAFRFMLRQGLIVLLFDGFDELVARVTYDRAADHLETLLQAAQGNAKIVVASRTQHFKTTSQVLTALGERVGVLPQRRVLGLEDFSTNQIRTYLRHHYAGDDLAAERRFALMSEVEDLVGLSRNPRMLGFIANLDSERLEAAARTRHTMSAAMLYREILESWLAFEEQRTQDVPGAPPGLVRAQLWQAVTTLAFRLWDSNESVLRLAELTDVAATLTGLAETTLSPSQAAQAVGAGSLLVRTDEGLFGFIHASVAEWLMANEIAARLAAGERPAALSRRPLSQIVIEFLCDLAPVQRCEEWATGTLAAADATEAARANALRLSARLRLPGNAHLRGAVLRGEDLSHREFAGVDLTGADLSASRLVQTNLRGAVLRDAKLAGAWLDETKLAGADLTGADLTGTRLFRPELQDVNLTGSTWRRAAVIEPSGDPELLRAPELRAAAIAPGRALRPGLAPPAIGVGYGFEIGRLPSPIAYGPSGGTLAIGSDDGGVLICDAATALPVRTLQGHRGRVYGVAYDTAAGLLVTASADGTVRVWDADHGDLLHVLDRFDRWAWPLLVDERHHLLAAGDAAGTLRVFDTASGTLRWELCGLTAPVWACAAQPVGEDLAIGDDSGTVHVLDVATGGLRYRISAGRPIYRLGYRPDGNVFAAAGRDGTLRLHDGSTGAVRHELSGHDGHVYAFDFDGDGMALVSGDTQGALRVWDARNGTALRQLPSHSGAVYSIRYQPETATLATADSDGVVRIWDTDGPTLRHELTGHRGSIWPVAFRPHSRQLATSSNDGTTRLWDVGTGQCQQTLRGHGRRVTSISFHRTDSTLATCGNDGIVRLWNPYTGQCTSQLVSAADRLISAVFGPGPTLAAASGDGGVHLWNVETGLDERELNVDTDHVWAEVFSPDGMLLATANDDDSVKLWYRSTGRLAVTLAPHRGRVRSIAFSPDATVVATGCDDGKVRLWDAQTGQLVRLMETHTDRVYSVQFNPDGTLLSSASHDGIAAIWDPFTGGPVRTLEDGNGRLWSAAFSPDGRTLAVGGDDLRVRLWNPDTGTLRSSLTAHTRRVWQVAFSPDGKLLASAGDDGTVRLWDVTDPDSGQLFLTLLGLPNSWAALSPDGRYKLSGDPGGQFWHTVGLCRFELGELDPYLPQVRQIAAEAVFS
jgi:WD40 repeat protein